MKASTAPLLMSLRPNYADLVFGGHKTAELRRRALTQMKGRDVYVYVTRPVMELRGGFSVGEVWRGSPEQIWETVSDRARVDKSDFDAYYAGQSIAYALEITQVWEYANPVGLVALRSQFHDFVVPQSWRYVKPAEYQSFRSMQKRDTGAVTSVRGHVQRDPPVHYSCVRLIRVSRAPYHVFLTTG